MADHKRSTGLQGEKVKAGSITKGSLKPCMESATNRKSSFIIGELFPLRVPGITEIILSSINYSFFHRFSPSSICHFIYNCSFFSSILFVTSVIV